MISTSDNRLGGRVPLMQRCDLSESQQQLFDHFANTSVPWAQREGFRAGTADGRLIGPFNPMLLSPTISASFIDFMRVERQNSSLSARVREIIILAVGAVWHSDYELYAHAAAARSAGVPQRAVQSLTEGGMAAELSASEQCAWRVTHQLIVDRRIIQSLYDEAQATFGANGIIEILLLIGAYQTICGILNAFEIPEPGSKEVSEDRQMR
jgi:4-carboxymuconolactone decarboxylase